MSYSPHLRSFNHAPENSLTIAARERIPLVAWCVAAALALTAFIPALIGYRVLYADGAYLLYLLLANPNRFAAIEFGRAVALHVMEAPVLLGELLSVQGVGAMARLLHLGIFGVPVALFLGALWLSRREVLLFAVSVSAFAVFAFSINFINTETNFYFAVCWLAGTILALPGARPVLRGAVLPVVAAFAISNHEGAAFSAPLLALWAISRARHSTTALETSGLVLAAFLFWIATAVAIVSGLAPRAADNASVFLSSFDAIAHNPQRWLIIAAVLAPCAILLRSRNARIASAAIAVLAGLVFAWEILRVTGYYGYSFYYSNRAGLALLMPAALVCQYCASRTEVAETMNSRRTSAYLVALIPLVFAVAGDLVGTHRWNGYVQAYCEVLQSELTPEQRLAKLEASGQLTGWRWTHPTLSVLLRAQDSSAFVVNPAGGWEPAEVRADNRLNRPGICQR